MIFSMHNIPYTIYQVLRLNHIGDWGTQFGMLIHFLKSTQGERVKKIVDMVKGGGEG